jgi:hypothetical protein
MNQNLDNVLHQAVDHGILPPDALQAPRPSSADRHWAVVLLTALGAWLALLPLLVLFAFALSDWIERVLCVQPGDYLRIPAGVEHRFTLTASRRIKALRLFADTAGWVAQYTGRPAAAMEVPA